MTKWKYARLYSGGDVALMPVEMFKKDFGEWLNGWLGRKFPELRYARVELKLEGRGGQKRPYFYLLKGLGSSDHIVGMALLQYLGSQGWELVNVVDKNPGSEYWLKCPLEE